MDEQIKQKALAWCGEDFDPQTRQAVREMIDNQPELVVESFYKDLEFGTGGLRGIMGLGTGRVNDYTIGFATQGLANYVKQSFSSHEQLAVAIAYDSRNQSAHFARRSAEILSANGIKAYLFSALRPTPMLSFAVRHLSCQAGIVITASHNPKEYNGYKVYWNDGGQLVPPHDKGVITEVNKVRGPNDIAQEVNESLINMLGEEMDRAYLDACDQLRKLPVDFGAKKTVKICFTGIHGTGSTIVPRALKEAGFEQVSTVKDQDQADGNFPTVASPNPEETSAMAMAIAQAEHERADIIFGTDPDSDRVGMGVRNDAGDMVLLNGNEAASLLIKFLCEMHKSQGAKEDVFIAKTIVTTELLTEIAAHYDIPIIDTLTGFKYIAEAIRIREGQTKFLGGGEESYGYLIGDLVRDKDAVLSTVILAEMAAWVVSNGQTVYEFLKSNRVAHGFYKEALVSLVKKGKSGAEEIDALMQKMRNDGLQSIAGSKVIKSIDYLKQVVNHTDSKKTGETGLPASNVLQFFLEDGSKITARPSGTEPKIKYYISVKAPLDTIANHDTVATSLDTRINELKTALGI